MAMQKYYSAWDRQKVLEGKRLPRRVSGTHESVTQRVRAGSQWSRSNHRTLEQKVNLKASTFLKTDRNFEETQGSAHTAAGT